MSLLLIRHESINDPGVFRGLANVVLIEFVVGVAGWMIFEVVRVIS